MSKVNKSQDSFKNVTPAIKILLVGDSGVGKSSIMTRFCFDKFSEDFMTTIGVDFGSKAVTVDKQPAKVHLWDTAGQERFRGVTSSYLKGANAIVIVFDLNDQSTLSNSLFWFKEIEEKATTPLHWRSANFEKPFVCLIGNKLDVMKTEEINFNEIKEFASQNDVSLFGCTSAKTGEGVNEVMTEISRFVLQRNQKANAINPAGMDASLTNQSSRTISFSGNTSSKSEPVNEKFGGECCGLSLSLTVADAEKAKEKERLEKERLEKERLEKERLEEEEEMNKRKRSKTQISDRPFVRLSDNSLVILNEASATTVTPTLMLWKLKEEAM